MKARAIGIYRESEFSPGKVQADAQILDEVLGELSSHGIEVATMSPEEFASRGVADAQIILAMCQSENALRRLAEREASGVVVINSALAIRNCYRDLLGAGLIRAGVPTPDGTLVATGSSLDGRRFAMLSSSAGVYVKRGDLHALGPDDVQHVAAHDGLAETIGTFARRGIERVFIQQAVHGRVVKFYGVSGSEYFTVVGEEGEVSPEMARAIGKAGATAANALGLEVWGGDAIVDGDMFSIVDFNDWPSFSRVRTAAARAIARRTMKLLSRRDQGASASR
jgi:hypothetical protein